MKWPRWVVLVAILTLATLLRWIPGGSASLGVDDGVAILHASRPLVDIMPSMVASHEVHPPLYFYYLHLWVGFLHVGCFRDDTSALDAWMHLSSLPWALAVVYLTWCLGDRLGGRSVAVASSLLVATSDFLAYYALEVRMYSMLTVLVLCAALAVHRRKPWSAAAWMLVAFLTQYEALFYMVAIATFLVLDARATRKWGDLRPWLVPASVVGALVLAWSPLLLSQANLQMFSLRPPPSWPEAVELVFELGCGVTWPFPLPHWYGALAPLKWLGLLTLLGYAGGLARASAEARRMLASLVGGAVLMSFAVSTLTTMRVFEYKYFQPVVPFLCIALGFWAVPSVAPASDANRMRRVLGTSRGWGPVALVIAVNLAAWAQFNERPSWYGPQDWRRVTRLVAGSVRPGDLVLVNPSMMAASVMVYAAYSDLKLLDLRPAVAGAFGGIVPIDTPGDRFRGVLRHARRVWFVTTPNHPLVGRTRLLDHVPADWKIQMVDRIHSFWPANRIWVLLLERGQAPRVRPRANASAFH